MKRFVLLLAIAFAASHSRHARATDLFALPSATTADNAATVSWHVVGDSDLVHSIEEAIRRRDAGMPGVTVADTVTRTISVATEPGVSFDWPRSLVVGADLNGLTISAIRDEPARVDAQGRIVSIRVIELEPFLPGDFELGPFEFTIRREGDKTVDTLTLPSTTVSVAPLLPDEPNPELAGPKGVVDAPEADAAEWTPWIVGGSVVLAIGAVAATVIATRRLRAKPTVSPKQRALASLAILDDRVRGEAHVGRRPTNEQAYTDLSSTLRRYIEDRFDYRATARTTEEFLRDASEHRADIPDHAAVELRSVMEACDEVKFGGAEPGMHAAAKAIEESRAFVESFGDREESRP
jgi:hypothetical protein